ncbi:hypothetical protein [Brevibacillus sp. BC25]|nr:hypothetical protein [Brevibacillus sp. BC25]EJL30272.1 hypothetical protein PMI05_01221 [Brevibacillus sp. BC25]
MNKLLLQILMTVFLVAMPQTIQATEVQAIPNHFIIVSYGTDPGW